MVRSKQYKRWSMHKKMSLRSFAFAMSIVSVLSYGGPASCYEAASNEAQPKTALTDQRLQEKVTDALESDCYFYAAHVNVSVKNGVVVLHGFVFSDWDLRDAIRIANRAAAGNRVVNELAIEVGGRR